MGSTSSDRSERTDVVGQGSLPLRLPLRLPIPLEAVGQGQSQAQHARKPSKGCGASKTRRIGERDAEVGLTGPRRRRLGTRGGGRGGTDEPFPSTSGDETDPPSSEAATSSSSPSRSSRPRPGPTRPSSPSSSSSTSTSSSRASRQLSRNSPPRPRPPGTDPESGCSSPVDRLSHLVELSKALLETGRSILESSRSLESHLNDLNGTTSPPRSASPVFNEHGFERSTLEDPTTGHEKGESRGGSRDRREGVKRNRPRSSLEALTELERDVERWSLTRSGHDPRTTLMATGEGSRGIGGDQRGIVRSVVAEPSTLTDTLRRGTRIEPVDKQLHERGTHGSGTMTSYDPGRHGRKASAATDLLAQIKAGASSTASPRISSRSSPTSSVSSLMPSLTRRTSQSPTSVRSGPSTRLSVSPSLPSLSPSSASALSHSSSSSSISTMAGPPSPSRSPSSSRSNRGPRQTGGSGENATIDPDALHCPSEHGQPQKSWTSKTDGDRLEESTGPSATDAPIRTTSSRSFSPTTLSRSTSVSPSSIRPLFQITSLDGDHPERDRRSNPNRRTSTSTIDSFTVQGSTRGSKSSIATATVFDLDLDLALDAIEPDGALARGGARDAGGGRGGRRGEGEALNRLRQLKGDEGKDARSSTSTRRDRAVQGKTDGAREGNTAPTTERSGEAVTGSGWWSGWR